jgi:hypothetical protein
MTSAGTLITSISEKLAHRASNKQTRTEIWTACGKRIRQDRLLDVNEETMITKSTPSYSRVPCKCAK